MHELEAKLKPIKDMKEHLSKWCESEIAKGCECITCADVEMLGDTIDMIKDLAETEEKCIKAHYYKKIIEAMDEEKKEEELRMKMGISDNDKMGYNHRHYASGRFAPTGKGTRIGYHEPDEEIREMWHNDMYMEDPREFDRMMGHMGYSGSGQGSSSSSNSNGSSGSGIYGYSTTNDMPMHNSHYDQFKMARKHYTETGSRSDQDSMKQHGDHAVNEAIASMKDIYQSSDPEQQKKFKDKMMKLLNEMP